MRGFCVLNLAEFHTLLAAVHTGFMGLRYINFQKNTCSQRLILFQNKTNTKLLWGPPSLLFNGDVPGNKAAVA